MEAATSPAPLVDNRRFVQIQCGLVQKDDLVRMPIRGYDQGQLKTYTVADVLRDEGKTSKIRFVRWIVSGGLTVVREEHELVDIVANPAQGQQT
jgi:hypothetical protein